MPAWTATRSTSSGEKNASSWRPTASGITAIDPPSSPIVPATLICKPSAIGSCASPIARSNGSQMLLPAPFAHSSGGARNAWTPTYDGLVPATTQKKAPAKESAPQKKPGELFLIDGNSLAYRAFFALPESIATHDGRPTNAIYGLASMFAKMLIDHDPSAVVVCWDAGWSGRELTYEPYKSERKPRPDLLRDQWPHLMPLAEAFGFTNIRVDGYEADDVIASLVKRAREQDIPVMVVSGDRDVYQLVEDGVRVMTTSRGVTDTRVYDRQGVIERYGVPPELVTDLIGLKGDTSDNIPGVPGIGDKRKENLTNHAEDARISKKLATAITDIDVELDLDGLMAKEMDRSRLREVA